MRYALALLLLLTACVDRSYSPVTPEALGIGTPMRIFATTSRAADPDGSFGFERSETLSLLDLTVTIPPEHKPAEVNFAYANPNPRREFTLAARTLIDDQDAFLTTVRQAISAQPQGSRELVIFVHGYNATHLETAFRAAQIAYDLNVPGTQMIYSWPSRGSALGYAYDGDSKLFARNGLEQTLRLITRVGAERVVIVAHSLGSALVMETLRQIDLSTPGWSGRELGGLILVSPDLDVDVFRSQMEKIIDPPQPFIIFASQKDRVLDLSARIRGSNPETRLGRINTIERLSDFPIEVIDTTALADDAGSTHFAPATSPLLVSMISQANQVERSLGPGSPTLGDFLTGRPDTDGRARLIALEEEQDLR